NGHGTRNGHHAVNDEAGDYLFDVAWQQNSRAESAAKSLEGQNWLIFSDTSGLGCALRTRLEAKGARCVEVVPRGASLVPGEGRIAIDTDDPAEYERTIAEAFRTSEGSRPTIVYLWGLDSRIGPDAAADEITAELSRQCERVIRLVRSLTNRVAA